jgi:hypothetical protein
MSYIPLENTIDFIKDLYARKEFHSLEVNKKDSINEHKDHLVLQSYQRSIPKYINPNTTYHRIVLKWGTGTGKSLEMIFIARDYIKLFKQEYNKKAVGKMNRKEFINLQMNTPTVYIIGFTKDAIIKEFLKWPELGFISYKEKIEMEELRKNAESNLSIDVKKYSEFLSKIIKRIHTKKKGGFYKFIGYKKLVNDLFTAKENTTIEKTLEMIEKNVAKGKITLVDAIMDEVSKGNLFLNRQLLESFRHSVIMCDEIHNTYNTYLKNNWGLAIQFILDYFPDLPAVFVSATPINNSPSEIVDLLNMLLPQNKKLIKSELFTPDHRLKSGTLQKIATASIGYFSFLQVDDPNLYPRFEYIGNEIKSIPYIKFYPVVMSPMHQKTYDETENNDEDDVSYNDNITQNDNITHNLHILNDMVFPNPDSTTVGLYDVSKLKTIIGNASTKWKDKVGIDVNTEGVVEFYHGSFLHRDKIGQYSAKYKKLIDDVIRIIKKGTTDHSGEKIFIYHHNVKNSGVLLIEEMIKENGIIGPNANTVSTTLCVFCGEQYGKHKHIKHSFKPVRYIIAHNYIKQAELKTNLFRFNTAQNKFGEDYKIVIGSRKVSESYEFKDVRHHFIMGLPVNISTLLQLIGRTRRQNSHSNLPESMRSVSYYIFVYLDRKDKSLVNKNVIALQNPTNEANKWVDKMKDYVEIQKIETELNSHAVDAPLNRKLIETTFDTTKPKLGDLYFNPLIDTSRIVKTTLTFNAYGYYQEEINEIIIIIKRLFLNFPIYTYDELYYYVKNPPFNVQINCSYISEYNFIIALNYLTFNLMEPNFNSHLTEWEIIHSMFNPREKYILNDRINKIVHIDKYYILLPVINGVELRDVYSYFPQEQEKVKTTYSILNYINKEKTESDYNFKKMSLVNVMDIFKYNTDFILKLLIEIIENKVMKRPSLKIFNEIEQLFVDLKLIYYKKDLKNVKMQFKKDPIGYLDQNVVRVFDGTWNVVDRHQVIDIKYKENDDIIGYFVNDSSGKITMKLRNPIQKINVNTLDTRKIEKGTVCETKSKVELISLLKKLHIPLSEVTDNRADPKIKIICTSIRNKLIDLEIKERQKGSTKKYLYMFNEENPLTAF